MPSAPASTRLFSGIQPSGQVHLGNYEGAIRNWVALQDRFESLFCVVDWHALTQRHEPEALQPRILDLTAWLLAAGIDPERATLFVQSHVAEHLELAWYFATVCPMGELLRQTQFKDKSAVDPDHVNAGLFSYPVLQAADILLYRAEVVPVGEDQVQHLELSREIARRWNGRYGDLFPEPRPTLTPAKRVMGLDGDAKMSKSKGNGIALEEAPDAVWAKLRTAKTDERRQRRSDPGEPEDCNIFSLHELYTPLDQRDELAAACRSAGIGCIDCKKVLAGHLEAHVGPIRERHRAWMDRPDRLREVLSAGADRARDVARETLREVRERMGVRRADGAWT